MTDDARDAAPGVRVWVVVVAIVAIAAVAFAIGRFTAFGTAAEPAPNAADAGFARDMQVHHAQAVEMAMQIQRTTSDEELRVLSYDIATGQSAQRGQMYEWLAAWGLPQTTGAPLMSWMSSTSGHDHGGTSATPATDAELRAAMGMATQAELDQLSAATGTAADCRFLGLMIRHHQGAIQMVDAVLTLGSRPNVLQTAAAMKQTQSSEIDAMTAMQSRLGCG
ncbi:DUF305 domain-containing protein [Microbacterium sp. CJ88]|uniref:DUF305 domain-containing protein n=1 Tax=Microbacterium sp. CJ88 TaxID=3445672 RepID=UPI003F65C740